MSKVLAVLISDSSHDTQIRLDYLQLHHNLVTRLILKLFPILSRMSVCTIFKACLFYLEWAEGILLQPLTTDGTEEVPVNRENEKAESAETVPLFKPHLC